MPALAGPLFVACALLALGGLAKAVAPVTTRRALYALGLPSAEALVRALGVAEIVLAIATVLRGGVVLPVLVGVAYVGFAGFVVAALRSGQVSTCGCFGARSTPPTRLHVGANLCLAGVAVAATGTDGIADVIADQPWAGVPFLGLVTLGGILAYLLFTALPALGTTAVAGPARRGRRSPEVTLP